MFDQTFSKVASFQRFKVVKPGKRRRGAQRQGELDCLHEQFICYQYLHQFQQVSAPGSWRPCREGQRSNWDESTEEPRDHGICRLEIQLNFWTASASGGEGTRLRDTVPLLRGWTMTGRMVKPSFRARGFHLENISDPIFNDLGMVPCLLQKSLRNKWIETLLIMACTIVHICQYIICHISERSTAFPINNDEHLLYTRPPSTPGVTEMRLSCTSGQDVLVSSPDLSLFIRCRYLGETSI